MDFLVFLIRFMLTMMIGVILYIIWLLFVAPLFGLKALFFLLGFFIIGFSWKLIRQINS